MLALFLIVLASCSNDTVDVAQEVDNALTSLVVSLEGKTLYGDYMKARFEGAHRAYVTMFDNRLSEDENLYTYSATASALTLQMQKICAPDGSGLLVTQEGYIGYWNSESFKQSYITEGISDYYTTKTTTITASDGTVYTYTNKTSYDVSGNTVTQTTSGTSKKSGSETTLFTNLEGYTEFERGYSPSVFKTVVTVTVYKATVTTSSSTDDDGETVTETETSYEAVSNYALSLVGATIGDSETAYGSDDTATSETISLRQTLFKQRYNELSANDWYMVRAAFKPYSYTYSPNARITESYIDDDGKLSEESITYDYVLTQHYTSFETAIFVNKLAATSNALGAVLFGYGYGVNLYFIADSDASEYEWRTERIDTEAKTVTFCALSTSDDTDESDADTITATYALTENGDKSTLTLAFETKSGSLLSGETITLDYYPIEIGLNVTE